MRSRPVLLIAVLACVLAPTVALAGPQATSDRDTAVADVGSPESAEAVDAGSTTGAGPADPAATAAEPADADTPDAPEDLADAPDPEDVDEPTIVHGDRFVFTGSWTIPANRVRTGDVVTVGGRIRVDGRVRGSVVVIGGDLDVAGRVDGDVVAVLSDTRLMPGARIDRGIVSVLGQIDDQGARVRGDYVNIPLGLRWPGLEGPFRILVGLWLWTKAIVIVLVFLGIVVIAALAPDRVRRLGDETARRGLLALLVGVPVFVLGLPLVLLVLTASLVGILVIPVALLAAAAFVWFGYAGVFEHVGRRIGRLFRRDLSVLAAMLLGYLVFALIWFVPIVGLVVWTVLTWIACGLLITGRLGAPPIGSGRGAVAAPSGQTGP